MKKLFKGSGISPAAVEALPAQKPHAAVSEAEHAAVSSTALAAALERGQKLNSSELKAATLQLVVLNGSIFNAVRATIDSALEAGRLLDAIKRSLPYGQFKGFVQRHCPFSYDTASRYRNLWVKRGKIPGMASGSVSSLSEAYRLLAPPKANSLPASIVGPDEATESISIVENVKQLWSMASADDRRDIAAWLESQFPGHVIIDVDFTAVETKTTKPQTPADL